MSQSRRIGTFKVARGLVEEDPEMVMKIMGRCVVIDCKLHYIGDFFEYCAISPDFDETQLGQIAPEYSVLIEEIDEQFKVSFTRVPA